MGIQIRDSDDIYAQLAEAVAAYKKLLNVNTDLLAALEELDAVGRRLGVRPMTSRLDAHAAALARARAAILKARDE